MPQRISDGERVSGVRLFGMRLALFCLALILAFTGGCGDSAPVGVPPPCPPKECVPEFPVSPSHLILTPGDTAQLTAAARTADSNPVRVRWSTTATTVEVDTLGRLVAKAVGIGWAWAVPVADTTGNVARARSSIWVVTPDSGGQPFISSFHDAATGVLLLPWRGFEGRDSIDITLSYVLGHQRETAGPPSVIFEIRRFDSLVSLWSVSIPTPVRGRGASARLRLHLTQRDANGARRFPKGYYDFFVFIPLPYGLRLGDQTGYRVNF